MKAVKWIERVHLSEQTASIRPIAAALLGFTCLAGAQLLLLESRQPLPPLLLSILGVVLWLPLLNHWTIEVNSEGQCVEVSQKASDLERRRFYAIGAVFFAAIALLTSQTGAVSPLFGFSWLMSIALTAGSLIGGERFLPRRPERPKPFLAEASGVLLLMAMAALVHMQTPAPYEYLTDTALHMSAAQWLLDLTAPNYLPLLSVLVGALLVVAVYFLGRILGGRQTGFFAAGFTSVSGWTLALGKVGPVYSILALVSALYLAALFHAHHSRRRASYVLAGVLLGVGWLASPLFVYLALLVPLAGIFVWLDERRNALGIGRNHAAMLLMMFVIWLPAQNVFKPPAPTSLDTVLDPVMAFADGLSRSLLIFNLTGDPIPLHGIVSRPVFSPIVAAALWVGVLVWIARIYDSRNGSDSLPLVALVVALLPSALSARPPDLQRAALALPVSVTIAASGLAFLTRVITARWQHPGRGIAIILFLLALVVIAADARQHYVNTFLPVYEQATQITSLR